MSRNIAKNSNRPNRVHQRYRQTTDGRVIAYSEREREVTFAKNWFRFLGTKEMDGFDKLILHINTSVTMAT